MDIADKKKVLIIGGGFAGVQTAIELDKKLFDVHLFSERSFLYIYPLAIWIPVGKKKVSDLSLSLQKLARRHKFHFHHCAVDKLDINAKKISACENTFSYDYLVLAQGSNKRKLSGADDVSTVCGTPQKAEILREKYKKLIEQEKGHIAIGFGGNPKDPSAVRGGPAYEVLFNIDRDLRKKGLRDNFTLTFFAPMKDPGKRMGEMAIRKVGKFIEKKDIRMQVGQKILGFKDQHVDLENGEGIDADLTIYVSAREGSDLLKDTGLPLTEAGFAKAHTTGQIEGQEYVFGAGDTIDFEGPKWKAKQGHMAEVQGEVVAKNIREHAMGKPLEHNFADKVSIICLMDFGHAGAFILRDDEKELAWYLHSLGHFFKWAWGIYFKAVKLKYFPKLPGM